MMARQLFVGLLLGWIGLSGLLPAAPGPLTPHQLQAKAKQASKEKVCAKAKQRKKTAELCKQWGLA